MEAVSAGMKSLKPWQIAVLAGALLVAVGATLGGYLLIRDSGDGVLEGGQQLLPVQLGDLVNEVSVNGSLIFPNRETLTFGTQGSVEELMVEEGQAVEQGQALARLDPATIAALGESVAQARVNLKSAEDALVDARAPHTPLEVAQAEAKVANAALTLEDAQETLSRLLKPTAQNIAAAEARVANAGLALAEAQDALASVVDPTPESLARAEAKVTDARIAVDAASTELESLKSGPDEGDVAAQESQVELANTALVNAQRDLELTSKEWDSRIETATDSLDAASEGYTAVFARWLGIELDGAETGMDPDSLLASWGVDLKALLEPATRDIFLHAAPPDDPATTWSETVIYAWVNFFPGTAAATDAKEEMDAAWDAVQAAEDGLDTVGSQAATAVDNARAAAIRTQDSLTAAADLLAELREPASPLEIESAEDAVQLALASLEAAREELARLTTDPDEIEVEARRKQVSLAQADLDSAVEELAALTGTPDDVDLEARRRQVAVAEASLAEAEDELADLRSGVDPLAVALRESAVVSAQTTLDAAIERLEGSTLVAPWAATVSAVNVEEGQTVNASLAIVEVVDPTVVEVDGIVDEIDVLFIRDEARATVTMDALPGQVLQGSVSSIALEARAQQGVVSFPIRIRLSPPQGVQLPEGLSATASVVIREDTDVLLVPLQSIYGSFDRPVVQVMANGRIEEREVTLGNSDDFWAVVEGGLAEGEMIVMESQAASTQGGFAGFRGLLGGGVPGGGFGGGGGGGGRR